MRPRVDSWDSGAPDEVAELLKAAEELEQSFDAVPGLVVRQLTEMVRRQRQFGALRKKFDIRWRPGLGGPS